MNTKIKEAALSAAVVFFGIVASVAIVLGFIALLSYLSWQIGTIVLFLVAVFVISLVVFFVKARPGDPGE
jgi:membrane protein implicated in regulation of membrane protease activity